MNTANLYIREQTNELSFEVDLDFVDFMLDRLLDNWNRTEVKAMMHFLGVIA